MDVCDNSLITMADEAKRPTSWWLGWLVAIVIVVGVGALGQILGSALLGDPAPTDTRYQWIEGFVFGFTLLGLALWILLKERRPITSVGFRGSKPVGKLVGGIALGVVLMSVGVGILVLTGQYSLGSSRHTTTGADALGWLLPLLILFILQGSTEEAVTRGYMLQVGGRQLPGWVAVVGSAVFFTVAHLDFHPVILLNLFLFALFASFVALWQRSIWLICGIHAGWNFAQGNLYGLPISGQTEATALLTLGPTPSSNAVLTGADFGIEGGIVGPAVFLIAAAAAFTAYRRSPEPPPTVNAGRT